MRARASFRWAAACSLLAVSSCALVVGIEAARPAYCNDQMMDSDETDVDCGGSCAACVGDPCRQAADCAKLLCVAGHCTGPTDPAACPSKSAAACQACHDCANGAACVLGADCTSGLCVQGQCAACAENSCTWCFMGRCLDVTCGNGVRDGDESDVDCGGSCATMANDACGLGQYCNQHADCSNCEQCMGNTCVPDCSGSCPCPDGSA